MERQSPINIITTKTEYKNSFQNPLLINYSTNEITPASSQQNLRNTGHNWELSVFGENMHINSGPMDNGHAYQLKSIHAHWGTSNDQGAEHKIDNFQYSGELHFIHWNSSVYESFDDALNSSDGNSLVILGVFFKSGQHNDDLHQITDLLKFIKYKSDCVTIPYRIDVERLLPMSKTSYWSYYGSLTMEPYNEIVQWIVFKEPIECSSEQIESMRNLQSRLLTDSTVILESNILANFRETFDMADRIVYNYDYVNKH